MLALIIMDVAASKTVWLNFDTMTWNAGDRIACVLNDFLVGNVGNFKHWMLAVDNERVIHCGVVGFKNSKHVRIAIQNREKVSKKMFVRIKCINYGPGVYGIQAVERAMSWERDKPYWYNLFRCNCYH